MKSEEGKRLAHEYRETFNLKAHGQPPDIESSGDLYEHLNKMAYAAKISLVEYVVQFIIDKNPDLDGYLTPAILLGS